MNETTLTYVKDGQWWAARRHGRIVIRRPAGPDKDCAVVVGQMMKEKDERERGKTRNQKQQ